MDSPLIVFVHVPKTGGMTLHSILSRQLHGIFAESDQECRVTDAGETAWRRGTI